MIAAHRRHPPVVMPVVRAVDPRDALVARLEAELAQAQEANAGLAEALSAATPKRSGPKA